MNASADCSRVIELSVAMRFNHWLRKCSAKRLKKKVATGLEKDIVSFAVRALPYPSHDSLERPGMLDIV